MPPETDPKEPLDRKVTDWLAEHGFPLEFRVARAFRNQGFEVKQNHYVNVPDSENPREIDVLAVYDTRAFFREPRYELYIECKWSKTNPWVVFASDEADVPPTSAILRAIRTNPMGEGVIWLLEDYEGASSWQAPFQSSGTAAHGGRQTLVKKPEQHPDLFYAAMQSVTAITSASGLRDVMRPVDPPEPCTFAFPVVVVDAPLFKVSLAEGSDQLSVTPINRARVFWRGLRADALSCVELVQASIVEEFAAECIAGIQEANSLLLIAQSDIMEALRKDTYEPLRFRLHKKELNPPIIVPSILRKLTTKYDEDRRARST